MTMIERVARAIWPRGWYLVLTATCLWATIAAVGRNDAEHTAVMAFLAGWFLNVLLNATSPQPCRRSHD